MEYVERTIDLKGSSLDRRAFLERYDATEKELRAKTLKDNDFKKYEKYIYIFHEDANNLI